MANLPEATNKDPIQTPRARKLARLLIAGYPVDYLVEKLSKGNPVKANIIRTQIGRLIHHDDEVQMALGQAASGLMKADIPEAVQALGRRAKKGNVPAIKLAMEASGFHNPRLEHHHSGKIEIELKGVARAALVEDHSEADDNIVDADVV